MNTRRPARAELSGQFLPPARGLVRVLASFAALVMFIGLGTSPVQAITGGQPDGEGHPYVALLLAPGDSFCSGTLISEQTILTAGHCTDAWDQWGIKQILVSFEPQAEVDENLMPVKTEEWFTASGWQTHPDYVQADWPYTYDYGLLFLGEPVTGIEPADLPAEYQLQPIVDSKGQVGERFTDVGFGVQGTVVGDGPPRPSITWERKFAVERYAPGNGATTGLFHETWFNLTSVPSGQHGGGCGGDSGSPILWGDSDTIVAVHTGGYKLGHDEVICGRISSLNHRIDLPEIRNWIIANLR